MVQNEQEDRSAPAEDARAEHREFSLLPGIAFMGFGALLLAPLLYRADAVALSTSAPGRLLGLSLGIAFVLIGLPALCRAIINRRGNRADLSATAAPWANQGASESDYSPHSELRRRLERLFFGLAHLVVAVTLLGMILLVFSAQRGSVSGVPVGIGMLIAGLMYACGGICKALR